MLELFRLEQTHEHVIGVLRYNGEILCYILERPWLNNETNISCIPAGDYIITPCNSPTYGDTFAVRDVPGRSDILFHWGNWVRDSKGCLLTGSSVGYLNGERAVKNSKDAFKIFMEKLPKGDILFKIRGVA